MPAIGLDMDTMGFGSMLVGGFQPLSLSDFPGKAAAIVFTQGCNFCCPYCHNQSLWPFHPPGPSVETAPDVLAFLKDRIGRLGGVVITGGEPTLQGGLAEFLEAVKGLGFAVKLDTNGSRPEVVAGLLAGDLIDYVAMDVKAPPEKYDRLCGCRVDMDAIRSAIDTIAASGVAHHFRTTFYQELLSEADIESLKMLLPQKSVFKLQACRAPLQKDAPIKSHLP
jgi:pyruvate formate lyase activating enzyme